MPWVVVGLWLAALGLVGPLAGKFAGIQQNRAVDYLPDSADSTQVARIQDELPGGESTDLVLVYHRGGGLTEADRRTVGEQIAEVSGAYDLAGEPRGVPSKDGSTLMYPVSSTQPGQDEEARDAFVDGVRDIAEGGGGLSVEVGGPGALNTDMNKVFGTLDATLLLATLGVVTVLLVLIYRSPFLWLVPLAVAGVAAAVAMAAGYGLIGVQTSVAAHVLSADPERLDRETVAKALDDIAETCRSARGELRTTLEVLREHGPPAGRGPLPGLDGLPDLAEAARLAGARVEQTVRVRQASPAVGAAAYRIVQEALTNAVRHAGPEPAVHVALDECQGALHLSVRDDGTRPAPGGTPGFGLVGMRERARSVGGTLDAGPRTGGGFEVRAVLPLTTTGERAG